MVAVSGGADSVALLRGLLSLCADGPAHLVVAHFNHGLRDDSGEDQRFIVDLCQTSPCASAVQLQAVEFGSPDQSLRQQAAGEGLESAARMARYEFLKATAANHGARYVVTAHTADDQAETILHRIVRGTGVAGVAGIPKLRRLAPTVTLMRPLLDFRRIEIESYLQALGQSFRQDPTNTDVAFTRNRIRHVLLPLLAENYNPRIVEALLRLGDLSAQAQAVVDAQVEILSREAVIHESDGTVKLDCRRMAGIDSYLIRELFILVWKQQDWPLQDMSHEKWTMLSQQVEGTVGPAAPSTVLLPGEIRGNRDDDFLVLQPNPTNL